MLMDERSAALAPIAAFLRAERLSTARLEAAMEATEAG